MLTGIFQCLVLASSAFASDDIDVPRGTLTVDRDIVQLGNKSELSWDITYPVKAVDLVDKDEDGNCTAKRRVRMQVRVLAAAFGNNVRYLTVDGRISVEYNTSRIFLGDQNNVNPSQVVFDQIVEKGSKISVTGYATDYESRPYTTYTCSTSRKDKSVVALFDGEALPAHQASMYPGMQLNALDYIANYMDTSNRAKIGANQVIFLGDFNAYGSAGYDLNDYVILITFTKA